MREEISAFSGLEEWLVTNMGRELESGVSGGGVEGRNR